MWNGEVFIPQNWQLPYCRKEFGEGEIIVLERHEERTDASHRGFMAYVNEVWKNLPEGLEAEYPTSNHLRKKTLIRLGWADQKDIVCDTERDAVVMAAYLAPIHEYGIVSVSGNVIQIFTAKSQAYSAMNKRNFLDSAKAVKEAVAALIDTSVRDLERNAGRSA